MHRPCDMLFSAVVNRTWRSRRNAPAMVKARRHSVVPAMATASSPGESENSFTVRPGSGTMCMAPMAVKVMRDDRQRQKRCGENGGAGALVARRNRHRRHPEQDAEND